MGDCEDHGINESFWARMQTEPRTRRKWSTILELSTAIAGYIGTPHHQKRHDSSLGMLTPAEHANRYAPALQLT